MACPKDQRTITVTVNDPDINQPGQQIGDARPLCWLTDDEGLHVHHRNTGGDWTLFYVGVTNYPIADRTNGDGIVNGDGRRVVEIVTGPEYRDQDDGWLLALDDLAAVIVDSNNGTVTIRNATSERQLTSS